MPAEVLDLSYIANPDAPRLERLGRQLLRRLVGGHPTADSPYGVRECMMALEEFRGKRQGEIEMYNADRKIKHQQESLEFSRKQFFDAYDFIYKMGGSNEEWVKHFDLQIFLDADTGLYYCLLPEQYVAIKQYQNLPNERFIKRIERIRYAENLNFAPRYIPQPDGAVSLMSDLYRGGFQGNIPVVRQEDRAVFKPDSLLNYKMVVGDKLRFFLVIRDEREGLDGPGLMQDVSDADMVMGAEALLLRRGPEDKVNDNNATAA